MAPPRTIAVLRGLLAILSLLAVSACGAGGRVRSPNATGDLATPLVTAMHEEAVGDPARAVDRYLDALAAAAGSPDNPMSVPVAMAALDALVHRDVTAFSDAMSSSALADRIPPASLAKGGIDARLARLARDAEGPFVPSIIASARLALAERRGDVKTATEQRALSGCAREATVVGPVAWMPVSGSRDVSLLDRPGTAFPDAVAGPGPFNPRLRPMRVSGFGCRLPLYAETSATGVREVAIDLKVPEAGWIGLGLQSSSEAVLHAGGKTVIERPHALGGHPAARFARAFAGKGALRVVVRVGMDTDYESIAVGAWDADGRPLEARAPIPGQKAEGTVTRILAAGPGNPRTDPERVATALGALAANDAPLAESALAPAVLRTDTSPEVLLVYARAVRAARDLPNVKSQERARSAYDRVLEVWPSSWEAIVEHAVLAGARRGRAEAAIEALSDLDATRAKASGGSKPGGTSAAVLDAFEAQTAGREHLYDRAHAAFERIRTPLAGSALLADTDRVVFERTGKDLVRFDCSPQASDRTSLACHHALVAAGDRDGAEKELERLRLLAATPQLYLSLSSRSALETGDLARAGKILDAMNPGDRALSSVYGAKGKSSIPELMRLAPVARDAPAALPSLLRDAGDDPIAPFDGLAEKVVNDAAASSNAANAATTVLAHHERYAVEPTGLVHFTMLDVRRVMGTTDVDSNAQAAAPLLFGRDSVRVLRRRIFKKDGRVVEPDRTPNASQSHADLSQLEAGDAIEAIYEGWGLPNETGNVGIDTPDLLPERTTVRDATIELSLPADLKASLWAHPMLGKAEEKTGGGKRVMVWRLKDHPVRRLESGVPKMDRNVGVSFSTTTWNDVARGLRETLAALESDSPEVLAWAHEAAAGSAAPNRELVDKIVAASGHAVKEASGSILADIDLGRAGGHGMTARAILVTHEGSRTWLITAALRKLGVKTDIAVAENDPFSDSATFPPHFGRFMHPLAIAHVPDPAKPGATTDVWIDADVPGPPLPAGRISPELRGRNALYADGKIAPLPATSADAERDEIDIRLTVDDQGNAKGTMTVLLRGHSAQDLAEALTTLVGVERQRALRGIALGWVPFATVEKVELSSSEESWQVAMRADLTAPGYAQLEGTKPETRVWILPGMEAVHYVFPRPFVTSLSSTYAAQAARESALAINHATQYHVRRRVDLPASAKITRLPGPFEGRGPLLAATRSIAVNGTAIEEDFKLDVTTGTVPRAQYEAFVGAASRTDHAFSASTRVRPTP